MPVRQTKCKKKMGGRSLLLWFPTQTFLSLKPATLTVSICTVSNTFLLRCTCNDPSLINKATSSLHSFSFCGCCVSTINHKRHFCHTLAKAYKERSSLKGKSQKSSKNKMAEANGKADHSRILWLRIKMSCLIRL